MELVRDCRGFTLVEMLIVIIIVGMMAGIAIPRIMGGSEEANAAVLEQNMAIIRKATEMYFHQHDETWPGAVTSATGQPVTTQEQASRAFERQLLTHTAASGIYTLKRDAAHPYGPYIKGMMPENPYNGLNTVLVDYQTANVTHDRTNGTTGWKFYALTGKLLPNHVNNTNTGHTEQDRQPAEI